jgi:acyl-CoA synthetase (NDP forming)
MLVTVMLLFGMSLGLDARPVDGSHEASTHTQVAASGYLRVTTELGARAHWCRYVMARTTRVNPNGVGRHGAGVSGKFPLPPSGWLAARGCTAYPAIIMSDSLLYPIDALIAPRSIAIVGASDDAERIGGRPLASLLRFAYPGTIYPINPNRRTVQGVPAFASIADVPGPVDCAILCVPASAVSAAAQACADKGVRSLVVFSAGFAEMGGEGVRQQQFLTDLARRSGMRILGPNCMGMFNSNAAAYLTFTAVVQNIRPTNGRMALVSQSGGYASAVLKLAAARNLHFAAWITTGNECDLEVGELIEALAPRPEVEGIVVYVEGVRDGPAFLRGLAAAQAHRKPVLLMKVGRTEAGAHAAASHTASIAGADWVYDAVLRQFGVHRVRSTEELIDVAVALDSGQPLRGARLGVVTTSGGIGAQIADLASDAGLEMPQMNEDAQSRIRALAPNGSAGNPVDVTGQIINDVGLLASCLDVMLRSGEYDAIYVYLGLIAGSPTLGAALLTTLCEVRGRHPDQLIMISIIAGPEIVRSYEEAGFLVSEDPSRAVQALAALTRLRAVRALPQAVAVDSKHPRLPAGRRYNELEAKQVFADIGIPAPRELLLTEALQPGPMEYPVALKVVSSDIQHKTEVGGVALGLPDEHALRAALETMRSSVAERAPQARVDGYLVSPMVQGGVECLLGCHNDPVFGPVVLIGLGGVAVEIFKDVACRLAPVCIEQAHQMIREIRSFPLLSGYRGRPPADLDALARAIASFSQLAAANADRLVAAEINPLLVFPQSRGVLALDAVLETNAGEPT